MKLNVYTAKSCGYYDIVLLLLCLQSYLNDVVMRSRKKDNICMLMYNTNNAKISLWLCWSSAKKLPHLESIFASWDLELYDQ